MDLPSGLVTFNNNILAAVDVETTGAIPGYHEVIQAAIVPLDDNLDPFGLPFYQNIAPSYPGRAQSRAMTKNGLDLDELQDNPDPWEAHDLLDEWFSDLNLPQGRRLIWLTCNAAFDIPFLQAWLGEEGFDKYFHFQGRDVMFMARGLNDAAAWKCQPVPFARTGLKSLCNKFGVQLDHHHDALADCLATARVYRELLRLA